MTSLSLSCWTVVRTRQSSEFVSYYILRLNIIGRQRNSGHGDPKQHIIKIVCSLRPLKMCPVGCLEVSGGNHTMTQSHMPEERDFACTVPQIRLTAHVKIREITHPSVCMCACARMFLLLIYRVIANKLAFSSRVVLFGWIIWLRGESHSYTTQYSSEIDVVR